MGSLSDSLLAGGAVLHVEAVHGEPVKVLSGCEAGISFIGVRENSADVLIDGELMPDPRARRLIRFREGCAPKLAPQDVLQTMDGKKWHAVKYPQDGYLTNDFELVEITSKDQG